MLARATARVRSHRAADSHSPGSPSPSPDSPRLNSPRYAKPPFPGKNHKEQKPQTRVWFSFWKSQTFGKSLEIFDSRIFFLRFFKFLSVLLNFGVLNVFQSYDSLHFTNVFCIIGWCLVCQRKPQDMPFGLKNLQPRKQCCGFETFISDPVSDSDPAFSEFWIWIRFRIRIRIRIKTLDLNPDQKQAKTSFSQTKKQIEGEGTAFLLELGRHYEIRPHSKPQIFLGHKYFYRLFAVLRIRDPVLFDPWIQDGQKVSVRIQDEQPELYFLQLRNFFGCFGVKILIFFDADPGSEKETDRIRDPGSTSRIRNTVFLSHASYK